MVDQDLLAASRQGDVGKLEEALAKGAKPDCMEDSGWMPLHLACAHRHEQVVETLLEANANPDLLAKVNGLSPLSILIRKYCEENADMLGHQRRSNLETTATALSKVQEEEEQKLLRIAEALLRFGADPSGCEDIQNPSSPIHIASRYGLLEIVKLLIEYGALMIHGQARNVLPSSFAHKGVPSPSSSLDETNEESPLPAETKSNGTLTPLGVACQAGEVSVMDYLLSSLPPQTLETSFVLQQAVLEARRNRQVDCLVGLWEYSEEVLWLDCERFANGIDPARRNGLEQTFFNIFTEPSEDDVRPQVLDETREEHSSDSHHGPNTLDDNVNTWLDILYEASRRRAVNLLQPLLLRLPNQDQFFEQIRDQHDSIGAALIQAVDRRDYQTLLHRFCAGEENTDVALERGKNPAPPVLSPTAAAWIRRLLQLSRESDEVDLEQIRLAQLESNDQEDMLASKYTAMYQSDWNLNLDSRLMAEESEGGEQGASSDEEADSDDSSSSDDGEEYSDSEESSEDNNPDSDGEFASEDSVETTLRESVDRTPGARGGRTAQQEGGTSDSDDSYSLASATASESDDGFRSQSSSEKSPEEFHDSFVELPSHSGKDLVNAADCIQQTPLHVACSRGVVPAISILLEEDNINVNATDAMGNTPFHVSTRSDVILVLLHDQRTDVNAANSEGKTRLHTAIEQDDMPIFQLLLTNGADLEITDQQGRTPLYFACAEGSLDTCSFLLAHGADPNATTKEQRDTPLHAASRGGHLGPILRLFDAQVDVPDIDGRTALHLACLGGHLEVVEYLVIELSASLNVQDKAGHTPFEVACHGGCADVVYYFVRHHSMNVWSRESRALALSVVGTEMLRSSAATLLPDHDSSTSPTATGHGATAPIDYREDPFEYSTIFDPCKYREEETLSQYATALEKSSSSYPVTLNYDTMLHPIVFRRSGGDEILSVVSNGSFSVSYDDIEPFAYDDLSYMCR